MTEAPLENKILFPHSTSIGDDRQLSRTAREHHACQRRLVAGHGNRHRPDQVEAGAGRARFMGCHAPLRSASIGRGILAGSKVLIALNDLEDA